MFSKSTSVGTDYIYGGPNYVTGQSYTVFMVYRLSATSAGRLLNTQNETTKDWMMGAYNGKANAFYPNFTVNLNGGPADTTWHLDWATWDNTTSTGKLYSSTPTGTAPSTYLYTATSAGGGGFNQLRLFSRSAGSEVQTANIGFIKVYDGVLSLSTIQSLFATYNTRFQEPPASPTPSLTPTRTVSITPTISITPSISTSATPSVTITPTVSATPSVSVTPSISTTP